MLIPIDGQDIEVETTWVPGSANVARGVRLNIKRATGKTEDFMLLDHGNGAAQFQRTEKDPLIDPASEAILRDMRNGGVTLDDGTVVHICPRCRAFFTSAERVCLNVKEPGH